MTTVPTRRVSLVIAEVPGHSCAAAGNEEAAAECGTFNSSSNSHSLHSAEDDCHLIRWKTMLPCCRSAS